MSGKAVEANKRLNPDIMIVAIDEKSLAEQGRWPWDRRVYKQFLEKDVIGAEIPKAYRPLDEA